jgi:hypothetical protein
VNALTGNEARGQMRFSIDRNALTGNAQNDTAYSINNAKIIPYVIFASFYRTNIWYSMFMHDTMINKHVKFVCQYSISPYPPADALELKFSIEKHIQRHNRRIDGRKQRQRVEVDRFAPPPAARYIRPPSAAQYSIIA